MKRVTLCVFSGLIMVSLLMFTPLIGSAQAGSTKGEEMTLLIHSSTFAKFSRDIAPAFEKETGIKVNIVEVPFGNLQPKFMLSLATGKREYDVISMTNAMMYGASIYLEDLEELFTPDVVKGFSPPTIESSKDLPGIKRGFPYQTTAVALYYRTDLFQERGLQPPTTWDEFLSVCKKTTIESSPVGKIWGTLIEASDKAVQPGVKLVSWFLQAGGGLYDENENPTVDGKQNIEALQFVGDLVNKYKVAPPAASEMIYEDVHNMFIQGRGATAINWQYMVSLANAPDSAVKGKFAVVPVPKGKKHGVEMDCWMWAIPTISEHKEAAKTWIRYATTREAQFELLKGEGLVARFSAMNVNDPRVLEINPFIKAWVDSLFQFAVPIPKWKQIEEARMRLSAAKCSAVTQVKSPAQALKDAQKEIEELLR